MVHLPEGTPSDVVNPDYGIRVLCVPPAFTGVSGQIRERKREPTHGVFIARVGNPLLNATVTNLATGASVGVNGIGRYELAAVGGPYMLKYSAPGYEDAIVFGLQVPPSGVQVDVQLERKFQELSLAGIKYTTYIDYSRGRTTFHTVKLQRLSSAVSIGAAPGPEPLVDYPLYQVGEILGSDVIINGTWWNIPTGNSLGYTYSAFETLTPEVYCSGGDPADDCHGSVQSYVEGAGTTPLYGDKLGPMLTIFGTGTQQVFDIASVNHNFEQSPSTEWTQLSASSTIWDRLAPFGVSDVSVALEISNPPLVVGTQVIADRDFRLDSGITYDYTFARTSVGIAPDGNLLLVVADGDGVQGSQGATANQLARFYRDVLGASLAMGLDSGLSTQMLLRRDGALYMVNSITGEDATIQAEP
jgi:hypothetical protein